MTRITFQPNTADLSRSIGAALSRLTAGTGSPPLREGFRAAGTAYLAYVRRGFVQRSGGGWQGLRPATQKQRFRQGFGPGRPILVRLGLIFRALFPGNPSNLFQFIPHGVRVGIADGVMHPKYRDGSGGNATVWRIALAHQMGGGRLPRRPIFHQPDAQTIEAMRAPIAAAVMKVIKSN